MDTTPIPVASAFAPFASHDNNTLKGCKWSPDGLCLLTASEEDRQLRLFELPPELMEAAAAAGGAGSGSGSGSGSATDAEREAEVLGAARAELEPVLAVRESESIYDYSWFPGMTSADPVTCVFASASREQPVHLWDAYTGDCRASYVAFNHLDEVTAPHSTSFDPSGAKLFCGFDRCVRVFDVSRPGRQCNVRPTCKTKRSRDGLRGLVSCFAFAPDYHGLYACGSYSGSTGLYDERDPSHLIVALGPHGGGVTQLCFSYDGTLLYSAARRDGEIRCWDVRKSCTVLRTFARASPTNQRIGFELLGPTSAGLLSASQDGRVLLYDTAQPEAEPTPLLTFGYAANAATSHPSMPLLAVAVGERRFSLPRGAGGTSDDADEEGGGVAEQPSSRQQENGLSVWLMPQHTVEQQEVGGAAASAI